MTDANQFEHFFDEDSSKRCSMIKSGKEASVHLCRANPRTTGEDLVALKTYHPLDRRDFRDESTYRDSGSRSAASASRSRRRHASDARCRA